MSGNPNSQKIRQRAAKHRHVLVARQNGTCWWCNQPIVELSQIPRRKIAELEPNRVRYWDKSQTLRWDLLATVDHVKPISEGGGNQFYNLVAACGPCNQERSKPLTTPRKDGDE